MQRNIWVGALAAAALWPAPANANTTCVGPPGSGCAFTTVADAVADANLPTGDADRIELRAGTHGLSATVRQHVAGGPLEIVGAGQEETVVTGGWSVNDPAFDLAEGALLSDLTLELPAGVDRAGIRLSEGRIARVEIDGRAAGAGSAGIDLQEGADAEELAVAFTRGAGNTVGVVVRDDGGSRLRDVDVTADYGFVAAGTGGDAGVVHGLRIAAREVGLWAHGGSVDVDGLLADVEGSPAGVAVRSGTAGSNVTTLRHATLRAPATGVGIELVPQSLFATTVIARETVVVGPARHARLASPSDGAATLDLAWSAVDLARIEKAGGGAEDVVVGAGLIARVDPGVALAGDPAPARTSPLVDAGQPGGALAPGNPFDVLGAPRVQDGDGDGTARRDIGAVELPPPPPDVPGPPGPPGPPSGPTPPGPSGTPTPRTDQPFEPPRRTGALRTRLAVPKGGVRADRRGRVALRFTCGSRGPCAGKLTLRSQRRIRLGGRAPAIATLATARFALDEEETRTVTLTLSRAARAYLARARSIAATARLTPRGGDPQTARLTLHAPRS